MPQPKAVLVIVATRGSTSSSRHRFSLYSDQYFEVRGLRAHNWGVRFDITLDHALHRRGQLCMAFSSSSSSCVRLFCAPLRRTETDAEPATRSSRFRFVTPAVPAVRRRRLGGRVRGSGARATLYFSFKLYPTASPPFCLRAPWRGDVRR